MSAWVLIVTILGGGVIPLHYGDDKAGCFRMAKELKADRENIADAVCRPQLAPVKFGGMK